MPCGGEREAFLREANVAVLATVDSRGRPHAAPIWYLYEDGMFLMSTGRGSQKHRNIERNPSVTLVVDKRTLPYFVVMAHGTAEIGPQLSEDERRRMAVRYLGEQRAERYLAQRRDQDSISIRLHPRRVVEYHGVAGREESD